MKQKNKIIGFQRLRRRRCAVKLGGVNAVRSGAKKRRVLFFGEAVTLAHVGRLVPLASHLHAIGDEVCLAADSRFDPFVGDLPFLRRKIFSLGSQEFLGALRRGVFPYSQELLERYVEDDLSLIRDFKPDVVIGDFRLSLAVSARVARVPYVQVMNAYWSPDFALGYPVPALQIIESIGPAVGQWLFNRLRPTAFRAHAGNMRRLAQKFDLPLRFRDVRNVYLEADRVLFSDIPELIPLRGARSSRERFAGPIHWSPTFPRPSWWDSRPLDAPWVCVSLGSSGDLRVLPSLLRALECLPVNTMLIGNEPLGDKPHARRFSSASIANAEAFQHAALVVGNGGSPAADLALREGVPFLGVPSNLDQYLMMTCVRHAGLGDYVRSDQATTAVFTEKIGAMLADAGRREKIERFRAGATCLNPQQVLDDVIRDLAGRV